MNINPQFFKDIVLETEDNQTRLSISHSDIINVINKDLDRRIPRTEELYSIEKDLKELLNKSSDLNVGSNRAYNVYQSATIPEIPEVISFNINMLLSPDGTPWILKNYEEKPAEDIGIDINEILQNEQVKEYLEKLYKENPYLKTLKPEAMNKFLNEILYITSFKGMFSEYIANREEMLRIVKEAAKKDEEIDYYKNYYILGNVYINQEIKDKASNMTTEELIAYYHEHNWEEKKLSPESELTFEANLFELAKATYEREQKLLKDIQAIMPEIKSIEDLVEIERGYQELLSLESAIPLSYLKYTEEFAEFLKRKDISGAYEPKTIDGGKEKYATLEEMEIYEFFYYQYGTESADKFKTNFLLETLNMRIGYAEAQVLLEKLDGKNFLEQIFLTNWDGTQDGLEMFGSGIVNLFNPSGVPSSDSFKAMFLMMALEDKILETYFNESEVKEIKEKLNSGEYTKEDIKRLLNEKGEDYNSVLDNYVLPDGLNSVKNNVLSKLYSSSVSIGNMLPSIALGVITGNPLIGSISMGVSSTGNAMSSALIEGADPTVAFLYGLCIGLSETTLGYFLGKVPGLSKGAESITNPTTFKAILKSIFVNATGEFKEEGLQFILDSQVFSRIFLGKTITFDEFIAGTAESAFMGFFTSILMGGGQLAINVGSQHINLTANQVLDYYNALRIEDSTLRMQRLQELAGPLGISLNLFGSNKKDLTYDQIDQIIQNYIDEENKKQNSSLIPYYDLALLLKTENDFNGITQKSLLNYLLHKTQNLTESYEENFVIELLKLNLSLDENHTIDKVYENREMEIGSVSNKELSRVLKIKIDKLINILSSRMKFEAFLKRKIYKNDYNIYLHAFEVLFKEAKGIGLEISEKAYKRLMILSSKYEENYQNALNMEGIINAEYTSDYDSALLDNLGGVEYRISSQWGSSKVGIDNITNILSEMPNILKENIKEIFFTTSSAEAPYWGFVFSDPHMRAAASANPNGILTFYESVNKSKTNKQTLYHEAAHFFDFKNHVSSSQEWGDAVLSDKNSVSDYGKSNLSEDWAESVGYYYVMGSELFNKKFPNRAKIIESLLGIVP